MKSIHYRHDYLQQIVVTVVIKLSQLPQSLIAKGRLCLNAQKIVENNHIKERDKISYKVTKEEKNEHCHNY